MQNSVFRNFESNFKIITGYYKRLIEKTRNNEIIGSINEWIVDNYYVISEQSKYIKVSFSSSDIKKIKNKRKEHLLKLVDDSFRKNEYKIDFDKMFSFLNKYQEENNDYFTYAEVDFIFFSMRISIINKLSFVVLNILENMKIKDNLKKSFSKIEIDNNFRKHLKINKKPYYIEELNYLLKQMGETSSEYYLYVEEYLSKDNLTIKEMIKKSHDDLSSYNMYMMNLINSLKSISKQKQETFYTKLSYTEKTLMSELVKIYDDMYESSKYEYRYKIIRESKKKKIKEVDYVKDIVEKANNENVHLGFILFKDINYDKRSRIYVYSIFVLTFLMALFFSYLLGLPILILGFIPLSNVAIEVINKVVNKFMHTKSLFKIKLEDGLSIENSTMVVIPTIIKDKKKVFDMFNQLETYYLSNKTANIYFTLLGDCTSSNEVDAPHDKEVVNEGIKCIKELNEKYGDNIFNFVYRNRFYSEGEECFLGFERKRGALNHFNKLLLNKLSKKEKNELFRYQSFDNFEAKIKYVITLDTDTKLVLNTALKLVGTMIHPLNKPVLSSDSKKVIKGHAIMQPRVTIDVEVTDKSFYTQLFAGLGGLDTYTTAYFDLYQNAFDEGSFVGKGIYDLEVFETIMDNTFPNNLILSHDMLEGNYLRSGLITDVELFDDYPSFYLADAQRHHRWNRGDYQISPWLFKKVRNVFNDKINNPLNFLSKWKILDNIRRSFVSLFLLLVLVYGFSFGKTNAIYYLLFDLFVISVPILFYLFDKVIHKDKYDRNLRYYLMLIRGIFSVIYKTLIVFALIPYETYLYLDSSIKSLYRMFISKKRLLNWIVAEEMEKMLKNTLKSHLRTFKINYIVSIVILILSVLTIIDNHQCAIFLTLYWLLTPFVIYYLGKPVNLKESSLDEEERLELKDIAFKTWRYFDDLMNDENNYLVPDNYQYNRTIKEDLKTSPTNIGYSLLSILSACELDFISLDTAMKRIEKVVKTMEKLPKWNGHLYNWYDIKTLKSMYPYFVSSVDNGNLVATLICVKEFAKKSSYHEIYERIENLISDFDFKKLYNSELDVFSVGYNDSEKEILKYHYNNFASEARLTSYVSIALGSVPYKHWFSLDKTLTKYKHYKGVASWSGTSFEYFMPLIFMRTFKHTLLDETYYYAYYAQKEFIREIDSNLPWGISESAYNELDDAQNYKYSAFGIPYLKFQESAHYPIVISPYASILAISIDEKEVYENIRKLKELDMIGEYGFYEAYDKDDEVIIKNHYAHHQGMILASLTNYLKDDVIKDYFESDKRILSSLMLLKEKVQIKTFIDLKIAKYKKHNYIKEVKESDIREYSEISPIEEMSVLSNGLYSIILNDRGDSLSKYKNLFINRKRIVSNENYGMYFYIKNLSNNKVWSNTYSPLKVKPDKYKVVFASDRSKYIREDDKIITTTEVMVLKDFNAEVRKITIENDNNFDIDLEVTSYMEVTLSRYEEDVAHRAFNSLMISNEYNIEKDALIFSRKSRTKDNTRYYMANKIVTPFENITSYETSREKFIGRGNTTKNPDGIFKNTISNKTGETVDPISSIRKKFTVLKGEKKTFYAIVGFGKSEEQVYDILDVYSDVSDIESAMELTTLFNNMRISYANLTSRDINLYNRLLKVFYLPNVQNNFHNNLLKKNKMSQSDLWKFSVSGDLPIILVEISKIEDLGFIKEVLQAFEYYKSRAIYIDVVIINKDSTKKSKLINDYIYNLLNRINNLNYFENSVGNVYVIDNITDEEVNLFKLVSKIYLNASISKSLYEQVDSLNSVCCNNSDYELMKNIDVDLPVNIDFDNSYGGFTNNGKEYFIKNIETPTPWSNIICNDDFGFLITNSMAGFTYFKNSREFKLTSWSNDPTSDTLSEMIKIDGLVFKPKYAKHGFGYSKFYSFGKTYDIVITVLVEKEKPNKIYNVEIINKTKENISIPVSFLSKFVLGVTEESTSRYLYSSFNEEDNIVIVKNNYNKKYFNHDVYMSSSIKIEEFIDSPIYKEITSKVSIKASSSISFNFILGIYEGEVKKYNITSMLEVTHKYWDDKLSNLKISTPDKELDYLMNGFLLYQVYASRLMSKAGFYQVGGATGFRDQLQDILAIIPTNEELAKKQIIYHFNHQFKEGDVLHWWHEELMFGARTRFSDDYLWGTYVLLEYIRITGDSSILNEKVRYIESEKLEEYENEKGVNYSYTNDYDTIYDRVILSINRALDLFGKNNIPLIGCGDWNDGFSKVGHDKKGESVFVAFFLYDILNRTSNIIKDDHLKSLYEIRKNSLYDAINLNCWDGLWYLRAFYDNGEAMGSRNNDECKIDLLSQSWSIISNVASPSQIDKIIPNVEQHLVSKSAKIIKLLTPSFSKSKNNPGYVMDYISGTRENGGQYTHAAVWYILALFKVGKYNEAYEYIKMINPINHTLDMNGVNTYKNEPYVLSADVYSNPNLLGKAGWSFYTGSASWYYKVILEEALGFKKEGSRLYIKPKGIDFKEFSISYFYMNTKYNIKVIIKKGKTRYIIDDKVSDKDYVELISDNKTHNIVVEIGE